MKRSVPLLGLFLVLALVPAKAQQAPDILKRTAAIYENLADYYVRGAIDVQMEARGQQQGFEATITLAERGDDFRAEVISGSTNILIVSNGDSTWIYQPQPNEFMSRKGGFDLETASGTIPDMTGEYRYVADSIKSAQILRTEALTTDQGQRQAYVLAVEYKPRLTEAGAADSSRKTLWIDKENYTVLKDDARAYLSESPAGVPMHIHEITTYQSIRFGDKLEDALFVFNIPANAKRIDPQSVVNNDRSGFEGKPAIDFTLKSLQGESVSLASQKGKVVLLNFWATWCGPCRTEMPAIEKLYKEYKDKGLVVLAVDVDERAEEVSAFIKEQGYTFPILMDEGGAIATLYRATGIPMSLIIDREGNVVQHFMGARPEEDLRTALKAAGLE